MRPYDWYHQAVEKIATFLPGLDPNLEVELDTTVVTPKQGGDEYTTFVLVFSHSSNPNLQWTMEVEPEPPNRSTPRPQRLSPGILAIPAPFLPCC